MTIEQACEIFTAFSALLTTIATVLPKGSKLAVILSKLPAFDLRGHTASSTAGKP